MHHCGLFFALNALGLGKIILNGENTIAITAIEIRRLAERRKKHTAKKSCLINKHK